MDMQHNNASNIDNLLVNWDTLILAYNITLFNAKTPTEIEIMETILLSTLEEIKNNGPNYYTRKQLHRRIYSSYISYYNNSIIYKSYMNVKNMILLRLAYCQVLDNIDPSDYSMFDYIPEILEEE